jgi:HAD superfamily hydrolase (TIGR01509 family)
VIPRFPVYLFDLDGTLLDSAEDICGAVLQTVEGAGGGPLPFEFLKGYIGFHLLDLFHDIFPRYTDAQIDALIQQYRVHYLSRGHKSTRLYPGVMEALEVLGGRKSIATTKGTPTTRLVLEQFGLLRFFDHVQGTDGFPCKPAPDVILRCLEAFAVQPGECLMVGDSTADMQAGRRAGVKTCAVRYGYGNPADLARCEPDYWLDDLRGLAGAGHRHPPVIC